MNQVRIIGGKWKRRVVHFENIEGLRPTPDRVRETLFNWLMWDVSGKNVLDLCAGSGVLGLEALSRGAASCILIEPNTKQAQNIANTLKLLDDHVGQVIKSTAQHAYSAIQNEIDILFLDPPYSLNLWSELAHLYDAKLSTNAFIYVEADRAFDTLGLPAHWVLHKNTKAGSVQAGLFVRR